MTLLEQGIVVSPEVRAIRLGFALIAARVDAWELSLMPEGWKPAARTVRTFRKPRPWLRTLR